MAHHAYIDESGTMDHQEVMTVTAVVFEGANSAEKLFLEVMRQLNPDYVKLVKQRKKACRMPPRLHYTDLSEPQKEIVGKCLATARVTVYSAYFWHDGAQKRHEERFGVYLELVKVVSTRALDSHAELHFGIAQQGGWQKYEGIFLAELKHIPRTFNGNGKYRKCGFELLSAAKPGIQIADFYAGALRDFQRTLFMPYTLIRHQVICDEVYKPA